MKCTSCKELDRYSFSLWDRICHFFFKKFNENINDLSEEKYTKGFSEGYTIGFKKAEEIRNKDVNKILEGMK